MGDLEPSFAPDGRRIAFTTGDGDIGLINTDGTGLTNLTHTPTTREADPTFSLDGTRVVFTAPSPESGSNIELFGLNLDGTGAARLTTTGGTVRNLWPDWGVAQASPLVAAFTASPTTGPAPLLVQYTDTSTGGPHVLRVGLPAMGARPQPSRTPYTSSRQQVSTRRHSPSARTA